MVIIDKRRPNKLKENLLGHPIIKCQNLEIRYLALGINSFNLNLNLILNLIKNDLAF
jgi:hypothetical protein